MKNLRTLLERFTRSLNKDEIARQAVCEAAWSIARVRLDPSSVSLKEGVLSLSAGAAAKNELRLKEEKIKEALQGLYDIRILRVIYK